MPDAVRDDIVLKDGYGWRTAAYAGKRRGVVHIHHPKDPDDAAICGYRVMTVGGGHSVNTTRVCRQCLYNYFRLSSTT